MIYGMAVLIFLGGDANSYALTEAFTDRDRCILEVDRWVTYNLPSSGAAEAVALCGTRKELMKTPWAHLIAPEVLFGRDV